MATDIGKLRDGKEDRNSAKVERCSEGRRARSERMAREHARVEHPNYERKVQGSTFRRRKQVRRNWCWSKRGV